MCDFVMISCCEVPIYNLCVNFFCVNYSFLWRDVWFCFNVYGEIVCFMSLGGFAWNISEYKGCCAFCVCLNCDASSCRWVLTGSTLVSSCKCWI